MSATNLAGVGPREALRLVAGAARGQVSVPLFWIRSRLASLSDRVKLTIETAGNGVVVTGEAHALGAPISFSGRIEAEGVRVTGQQRTVVFRLRAVELSTPANAPGPLAQAIRDQTIDTEHPASLVGNLIALPDFIVEAAGDTVAIDLMRVPALADDELLRAAVEAATSYLCVDAIRAGEDSIDLTLKLLPGGLREALLSTARAALTPAVRYLWANERAPR